MNNFTAKTISRLSNGYDLSWTREGARSLIFISFHLLSSFALAQVIPKSSAEKTLNCQEIFIQRPFLGTQTWVYNDFQENPLTSTDGKSPRQIFAQEKLLQKLATPETLEQMTFGRRMALSYHRGDLLIGFPEVLKNTTKPAQKKPAREILIGNPYLGAMNSISLPNIHWKKGSFHEIFRNLDGAVKVEIYQGKIYLHRIQYANSQWSLAQEAVLDLEGVSDLGFQPKFYTTKMGESKKIAASNEQVAVILLETTKPSGGLSFLFINLQSLEVNLAEPFGLPGVYEDIHGIQMPETGFHHFVALTKVLSLNGAAVPHYLKFERGFQLHRTQRFFQKPAQ